MNHLNKINKQSTTSGLLNILVNRPLLINRQITYNSINNTLSQQQQQSQTNTQTKPTTKLNINQLINFSNLLTRNYSGRSQVGKKLKQGFYAQSTGAIFNEDVLPGFLEIITTPLKWVEFGKFVYRNITSNAVIKSKLKALDKIQYTKKIFLKEAEEMFINLNESIARGDKNEINQISTIQFASVVIKNTGIDERNSDLKNNYKTTWTGEIKSKKMIWSRAGQVRITQKDAHFFAQNCIEFTGIQSIVTKDIKTDKVITSIENQPFTTQYIFERNLSALPTQWRICNSTENPILKK